MNSVLDSLEEMGQSFASKNIDWAEFELTDDNKKVIADLIMTLYFRGPRLRKVYNAIAEQKTRNVNELMSDMGVSAELKYDPVLFHAQNSYGNEALSIRNDTILSQQYWVFRYSENGNFMVSDNPVTFIDNEKMKQGVLFTKWVIGEHWSALFFPISNKLLLEIYNKEDFPEGREVDGKIMKITTTYEDVVNGYQFLNADKHIFSYTGDFSLFNSIKTQHNG
jgi:hypothetical protein